MGDFAFKQFRILQDKCAMKVGTDGVLLGAWADGGLRILDIGTGTGLIALMMAQRFPKAQVVGIDIDGDACEQAHDNASCSPFADRVEIVNARLLDYLSSDAENIGQNTSCLQQFDAIVSNPPFFVNSLKNPDNKRSMARHTDTLPFRDLWLGVKRLLADDGIFSVILPSEVKDDFSAEGCMFGFRLIRQCGVKTVERKQPKRYLLSFARHRVDAMENVVETMMDGNGKRSEWYQKITDEFYLS